MVYKGGMDQWLLAVTSDPAAKGSAKDLEVAGAGPVHCRFSIPPSFLTMCSSERCLSTNDTISVGNESNAHMEVQKSQICVSS